MVEKPISIDLDIINNFVNVTVDHLEGSGYIDQLQTSPLPYFQDQFSFSPVTKADVCSEQVMQPGQKFIKDTLPVIHSP